jgi:nucleoside 2-deoxyribosyltransferase
MPFSAPRTFVYEMAIKEAIGELNKELSDQQALLLDKLETQRADEIFTPDNNKVKQIKELIEKSDLVIVDISELNPNVLWELGYSTALDKYVILISEAVNNLPFNIRVNEICKYQLDFEGMGRLRKELVKRLRDIVRVALQEKGTLIRHKDFLTASKHVTTTLKHIREDSLLKQLALNELTRIGTRFEKLAYGLFELRNVKPYEEVIEYYCEYVSQLKGDDCRFDVVSNLNFWNEITRKGTDLRYILTNAHAAKEGAKIKRIILIDANEFKDRTVKQNETYTYILKILYNKQNEIRANFQTKLYFVDHFATARETYSNFGILVKGAEMLLFEPMYEGSRMKETIFMYINKEFDAADGHIIKIKRYETLFNEVWERGEVLDEKHFS